VDFLRRGQPFAGTGRRNAKRIGRDGMHRTSDLPGMSGTLWPSELRHGLAGEDGFEPPTGGVKVRCATGCATRPKVFKLVLPSGFDPLSPL
jgi:hypothetical protein